MRAQLVAVEVDGGVTVDAIELDADSPALPARGGGEGLAVPACSGGKEAASWTVGLSLLGAPSMLQSWGRLTVRHDESVKEVASAPPGSPRRNFQSESAANDSRASERARRIWFQRSRRERRGQ